MGPFPYVCVMASHANMAYLINSMKKWGRSFRFERIASGPLVGLEEGKRGERPLITVRVFSLRIGVEPSEIVVSPLWCSKLSLKTGVHLGLCHIEFSGSLSDTVRQVALATTT
ncbi:hypothetical protein TNCV_4893451 [Trichonephila clavipes]|nr:hypothetical protein TNCV_4893451 [Trichonephila clavipes]